MIVKHLARLPFGQLLETFAAAGGDEAELRAALERFIANPRHPGLHFEKLRGGGDLHSIRAPR